MESRDMTAAYVAQMTPTEAALLRDTLDNTPLKDLPGASEKGIARAVAAYRAFRSLLDVKVAEDC